MIEKPRIPANEEHVEAVQAETNAKRAAMKETMSPEDRARLEVIEECVAKLEAAKVPFVLWAASDITPPEGYPQGWCGWWQFNKLVYDCPFDNIHERSFYANQSLYGHVLSYHSRLLYGPVIAYDEHKQPRILFERGERHVIPKPPEIPPSS